MLLCDELMRLGHELMSLGDEVMLLGDVKTFVRRKTNSE